MIQKYDLEPDFLKEMRFSNDLFRADLISVSNTLEAFEITSQSDDLRQLTKQINAYLTFFEHVTIACLPEYREKFLALASQQVGVWLIHSNGEIEIIQSSQLLQISKERLLRFLPVKEVRALLKRNHQKSVSNRSQQEYSAESLAYADARSYVLNYLKRHKGFVVIESSDLDNSIDPATSI